MNGTKLTRTLATIFCTGLLLLLALAAVSVVAAELSAISCEECSENHCTESGDHSCACLHAHPTLNPLPAFALEWTDQSDAPSPAPQPTARDAEQEWFDAIDHPPQILH